MSVSLELEEVLALPLCSARAQATWIYNALRYFLDLPVEWRAQYLTEFTTAIDAHARAEEIRTIFRDFWSHHSYVRVISEAGLPDEVFLLRELFARAFRHLLPVDEVQGDLYVLLDSLDLDEQDARWLASLPQPLLDRWADIFRPSPNSLLASCKILAVRATNIALSRDFLALDENKDVTQSAFFTLPSLVERVVQNPAEFSLWETRRDACEAELRETTRLLEEKGSSASLVFRLRLMRLLLWRIQQILNLQRPESDSNKFAVTIVHGFASQRRIQSVVNASTRRLARSVVEKTGRVGLHYIAGHRAQWRLMGWGAVMAGVITTFTALVKYSISTHIEAPLIVAIGHSLNYAISFLLMQAGGFLLASKMPAATAATLVDAMEDPEKDHMASLRAISQTQALVTIGNLVGAGVMSILVDRAWNSLFGHPFLTLAEAEHGVHMLYPHQSLTIPFAIVTGVFLWLASLATGWTANYIALSRLAPAITNSLRLRNRIGASRADKIAHWVSHNAPGSMGYIVLGFLLGSVPIVVKLFGIPLEVRHVTLAMASLGYALDALWLHGSLHRPELLLSILGVLIVGVLNIFTSFGLSFLLAVRARDIREDKARRFAREVLHDVIVHPISFLMPGTDKKLESHPQTIGDPE